MEIVGNFPIKGELLKTLEKEHENEHKYAQELNSLFGSLVKEVRNSCSE